MLDNEGHKCQQIMVALIAPAESWDGVTMWWLLLLETAGAKEQTYRRVGLGVVEEVQDSVSRKRERLNFDCDWTRQVIMII